MADDSKQAGAYNSGELLKQILKGLDPARNCVVGEVNSCIVDGTFNLSEVAEQLLRGVSVPFPR
jgi:hypothetical protein